MSTETLSILITGGSGFLGSALAKHFLGLGQSVSLLLRTGSQLSRFKDHDIDGLRVGRCAGDEEIAQFIHDVQPQIIVHTACAYGRVGERVVDVIDTNLRFGLQILEATKSIKHPVTFINTGTVLEPTVSDYALSKHQFVAWAKRFVAASGKRLQFINMLLQHMYGPDDDPSKFTTHVLKACSENKSTLDLTLGEQHRDFVYIADVVSAYVTIVEQRQVANVVRFGTERFGGEVCVGVEIPPAMWHTVIALEVGCVLLEVKAGPFDSGQPKDLASWAPEEGSIDAPHYLDKLVRHVEKL